MNLSTVASILVLSFAVLLLPRNSIASSERHCEKVDKDKKCILYGPSLIELIARAEDYHGKRVRVKGYLHLEFEGNGLYVSREDQLHSIDKNGLWISLTDEQNKKWQSSSDHYVLVEGTFDARSFGHFGMWSGEIDDITRLDAR